MSTTVYDVSISKYAAIADRYDCDFYIPFAIETRSKSHFSSLFNFSLHLSRRYHRLRQSEEMLMKKQEYLEKQIEDQLAIIRQNGTKNQRVSMQALKRKKRLDQQLSQNDGN